MSGRYNEYVIKGARGWALGFIEGFLRGRDEQRVVLEAEAAGFDCESLGERIRELFRPPSETFHVLVPEELEPLVREAIDDAAGRGHNVTLIDQRPILSARFSFSFSVYSRKHASRIRKQFEELPEGVSLTAESSFTEKVNPQAKGIEAYAPVHHYELHAKGVAKGPVDGITKLLEICKAEELISVGKAELVFEKPSEEEAGDER
jgi:hypothetical protein